MSEHPRPERADHAGFRGRGERIPDYTESDLEDEEFEFLDQDPPVTEAVERTVAGADDGTRTSRARRFLARLRGSSDEGGSEPGNGPERSADTQQIPVSPEAHDGEAPDRFGGGRPVASATHTHELPVAPDASRPDAHPTTRPLVMPRMGRGPGAARDPNAGSGDDGPGLFRRIANRAGGAARRAGYRAEDAAARGRDLAEGLGGAIQGGADNVAERFRFPPAPEYAPVRNRTAVHEESDAVIHMVDQYLDRMPNVKEFPEAVVVDPELRNDYLQEITEDLRDRIGVAPDAESIYTVRWRAERKHPENTMNDNGRYKGNEARPQELLVYATDNDRVVLVERRKPRRSKREMGELIGSTLLVVGPDEQAFTHSRPNRRGESRIELGKHAKLWIKTHDDFKIDEEQYEPVEYDAAEAAEDAHIQQMYRETGVVVPRDTGMPPYASAPVAPSESFYGGPSSPYFADMGPNETLRDVAFPEPGRFPDATTLIPVYPPHPRTGGRPPVGPPVGPPMDPPTEVIPGLPITAATRSLGPRPPVGPPPPGPPSGPGGGPDPERTEQIDIAGESAAELGQRLEEATNLDELRAIAHEATNRQLLVESHHGGHGAHGAGHGSDDLESGYEAQNNAAAQEFRHKLLVEYENISSYQKLQEHLSRLPTGRTNELDDLKDAYESEDMDRSSSFRWSEAAFRDAYSTPPLPSYEVTDALLRQLIRDKRIKVVPIGPSDNLAPQIDYAGVPVRLEPESEVVRINDMDYRQLDPVGSKALKALESTFTRRHNMHH